MNWPVLMACILLLVGCGAQPTTGPVEPTWDRDSCEHCQMAISDRHFATQIRSASDGLVRHFDDPGCAILWRGDTGSPEDEIWVRDAKGETWVDARSTRFGTGYHTPMGYGYGATDDEGGLDWTTVETHVQERERERREHTAH
ncbi:MAG: protein NosL [Deltaproteobacteria bacterium]|nr:protein NosL [Deltaproteobacteria bacterium]